MFHNYTIEVFEDNKQVKAKIFRYKECLGTVWTLSKHLNEKEDFKNLFNLIGSVIYGKEEKAKKEFQPDSEGTPILTTVYHSEQETLGC